MKSKEAVTVPVSEVNSQDYQAGSVEEFDNKDGHNSQGKFRRSFLSRHIVVVVLGSNIGSGLFISTGKALRNGGPGNMIIGYTLVMLMVCTFNLSQSKLRYSQIDRSLRFYKC
jgi:amino acid permease